MKISGISWKREGLTEDNTEEVLVKVKDFRIDTEEVLVKVNKI